MENVRRAEDFTSNLLIYHVLDCSQDVQEFVKRMKHFKGLSTRHIVKKIQDENARLDRIASSARLRGDTQFFIVNRRECMYMETLINKMTEQQTTIMRLYWTIWEKDEPSWLQRAGVGKKTDAEIAIPQELQGFAAALTDFVNFVNLQQGNKNGSTDHYQKDLHVIVNESIDMRDDRAVTTAEDSQSVKSAATSYEEVVDPEAVCFQRRKLEIVESTREDSDNTTSGPFRGTPALYGNNAQYSNADQYLSTGRSLEVVSRNDENTAVRLERQVKHDTIVDPSQLLPTETRSKPAATALGSSEAASLPKLAEIETTLPLTADFPQPTLRRIVQECQNSFRLLLTMTGQEAIAKADSNLCVWSAQILDNPFSLDTVIHHGGNELQPLRQSLIKAFGGIVVIQENFLKRNVEKKYNKSLHEQRVALTGLLGYRELLPTALCMYDTTHAASEASDVPQLTQFELALITRHIACAFEMLPTIRAERRNYAVSLANAKRPEKAVALQTSMEANLEMIEKALKTHDQQAVAQGRPQKQLLPSFEPEKNRLESLLRASSSGLPWKKSAELEEFAGKKNQIASVLSSFVSNHVDSKGFASSRPPMANFHGKSPTTNSDIAQWILRTFTKSVAELVAGAHEAGLQTEVVELE